MNWTFRSYTRALRSLADRGPPFDRGPGCFDAPALLRAAPVRVGLHLDRLGVAVGREHGYVADAQAVGEVVQYREVAGGPCLLDYGKLGGYTFLASPDAGGAF